MNLLENNSRNSLELRIWIEISIDTINMWKNIHKTALTKDLTHAIIELGNHFDFIHYSNKLSILQKELIPTISQDHLTKFEFRYSLEMLLPNSYSKAIYD